MLKIFSFLKGLQGFLKRNYNISEKEFWKVIMISAPLIFISIVGLKKDTDARIDDMKISFERNISEIKSDSKQNQNRILNELDGIKSDVKTINQNILDVYKDELKKLHKDSTKKGNGTRND